MGLKISLFFVVLYLSASYLKAQDTLSCKKELTWDKTARFYYKIGDASKQKYTGPAKCYPQKGFENRGSLVNGNWEGMVLGYKENRLIGFATFKDGFYNGLTLKMDEQGRTKDSSIYDMGTLIFSKTLKRNKYDVLEKVTEFSNHKDTMIYKNFTFEEEIASELTIDRFYKGKRNGLYGSYFYGSNNKGEMGFFPTHETFYKDGTKTFERSYDSGELYEENQYLAGKISKKIIYFGAINLIESEIPFVNGKIHGEVKHYDEVGKLVSIEKYEKGKLIEVIER